MYSNIFSAQSVQDLLDGVALPPGHLGDVLRHGGQHGALPWCMGLPLGVLLVAGRRAAFCPCPAG